MRAPPSIERVRDADAFAALAADWWDLWRRCATATPFQSPAWLLAWWRHFAPGALRVLAVRDGGALVGLAPFYLEDGPLGRRLLPVGISLSDYLDVLIDPPGQAIGHAVVAAGLADEWERWELEELGPFAAALDLPCPADLDDTIEPQSCCTVLVLRGPDSLRGSVPSHKLRELRRARSMAEKLGAVSFLRTDADPAFMDTLFRLHGARWTSRGESGLFGDDIVKSFHRAGCAGLAKAGLARCYEMRIGEQPVAAYYGFVDRGRAYAYLTGFDPAFEAVSPGSLLVEHAIVEAQREGASEIHFLRGQERYKYHWGVVERWNLKRSLRRR